MASAATLPKQNVVELEKVNVNSPGEAFLLRLSAFPIPRAESESAVAFLRTFMAEAASAWKLSLEVFLQLEQFQRPEARAVVTEYAARWVPEMGLGVWPDREPPKVWTREEFMAAAALRQRLRPLMYQVFQITGSEEAKWQAHELMLPFGSLLEYMTSEDPDLLLQHTSSALLSGIKDLSYRCFPYYIPLLEAKTLATATPEMLEAWLGNSVYIRESFEDSGILMVSRLPLTDILEKMGGESSDNIGKQWKVLLCPELAGNRDPF